MNESGMGSGVNIRVLSGKKRERMKREHGVYANQQDLHSESLRLAAVSLGEFFGVNVGEQSRLHSRSGRADDDHLGQGRRGYNGLECPENPGQQTWNVDEELLVEEFGVVRSEDVGCLGGGGLGVGVTAGELHAGVVYGRVSARSREGLKETDRGSAESGRLH